MYPEIKGDMLTAIVIVKEILWNRKPNFLVDHFSKPNGQPIKLDRTNGVGNTCPLWKEQRDSHTTIQTRLIFLW